MDDPEKHKQQEQKRLSKWKNKHENQVKASTAVSNASRDGKLFKKTCCENCKEDLPLEAHHESYEETCWLDVVWLCDACHKKRHKILKEAKRKQEEAPVLSIPF